MVQKANNDIHKNLCGVSEKVRDLLELQGQIPSYLLVYVTFSRSVSSSAMQRGQNELHSVYLYIVLN